MKTVVDPTAQASPTLVAYAGWTDPEYLESLALPQRILDWQADLSRKIEPSRELGRDQVMAKWRAGLPALAGERLVVPPAFCQEALQELQALLPEDEPTWAVGEKLLASPYLASEQTDALLDELTSDLEACARRLAQVLEVEEALLSSLLHLVLSPCFVREAEPYQAWVQQSRWRRGICPICGSQPAIARLALSNGRRFLACPLCRTEWAFDRLRCPFCESSDQPRVVYFTLEEDEAHRVDCCTRCGRYLKTVDERALGRPENLLFEDILTAYLDETAREQGYR